MKASASWCAHALITMAAVFIINITRPLINVCRVCHFIDPWMNRPVGTRSTKTGNSHQLSLPSSDKVTLKAHF